MATLQIPRPRVSHKTGKIAAGIVLALIIAVALLAPHWPFSEHSIRRDLELGTSAAISFGKFHTTWFPHPGCIAQDVTLRNAETGERIGTIQRMQIVGTYSSLIRKRKRLLSFEADHVHVTASNNELPLHPSGAHSKEIELDEFVLRDAILDVVRSPNRKLTFAAPQLIIKDLGYPKPGSFSVQVNVPLPEMTVESAGKFGPLVRGNIDSTPVSGYFRVGRGTLATFDALRGKILANGNFAGNFGAVDVNGEAASPDFALSKVDHALSLTTRFRAQVTIRNAEIKFRSLDAELGKTHILGAGAISPVQQDAPGFLNLDLTAPSGTVNDLLWLFSKAPEPGMIGPIRFHTIAALSRRPEHFLQEIQLNGKFVINNARFSSPATQTKLEKLSKRAEGHPDQPPTYTPVSLLSGSVDLHGGVAYLSNVLFQVDGADANGGGTFDVEDKKVDLNGKLRMRAELGDTTKGFKGALLKLISPFYKKHGAGSDVPVSITGTSSHPKFAVHLMK
jgi:hypothetical protein